MSKAFDRISWPALWEALLEHGVPEHLVWTLQCLYAEQTGQVKGKGAKSRTFTISAGMHQGCVLSPRLFCSVLEIAMARWRLKAGHAGSVLGDGSRRLPDLRFADDVVFFTKSEGEAAGLL